MGTGLSFREGPSFRKCPGVSKGTGRMLGTGRQGCKQGEDCRLRGHSNQETGKRSKVKSQHHHPTSEALMRVLSNNDGRTLLPHQVDDSK